ncbi:NAD-binding protein [Enterovibrio coralii]|uniref:NAD-binding protein n=1 Tax=Enterovibrio coralii TaxID=294935 RepID=UPI0018DDD006|nr:NAD-binding protein [Enterovibrio coralii]
MWDVLRNSCARSYVVESYVPKVLDGSYDPSFTLALATKDMRLISELGEHLTVPLALGDRVFDSYRNALTQYGDMAPHLSIVRLIEEQTGQLLRSSEQQGT